MNLNALDFKVAATATAENLLSTLQSGPDGLDAKEKAARRQTFGPNTIPSHDKGPLQILYRQVKSPFIALLAAAASIAFLTGDPVGGALILLFMLINTGLGFFQEFRAERSVRLLKTYWESRVHAVRDGTVTLVPSSDLVPGDIVRLQAGDKIPADVRFIAAHQVTVDESILTGESVNVAKDAAPLANEPADWYQCSCLGFSGTSVLTGEAEAVVFATGRGTAVGGLAKLTAETKTVSAFEKGVANFSSFVLKLVIVTLFCVFVLNLGLKGWSHFESLLIFSIALTVGVIPEALPLVSTIAMSHGAVRMAEKKVVVKRLSAISDLGSIDILCTDKTGTVTKNELEVSGFMSDDQTYCLDLALTASSFLGETERQSNNAFDLALWDFADDAVRRRAMFARKLAELPFDPVRRRNAVLIKRDGAVRLVVRGSPDDILPLCRDLPARAEIDKFLEERGLAGERVIAVAAKGGLDDGADPSAEENGLDFIGLIAFVDPLKPGAVSAARKAKSLGVQIKILTGDSREVAGAVGHRLGLVEDPRLVITGAEFDALDPAERHRAAKQFHIFARMNPAQKFEVLEILQMTDSVGFLGEGFNDAPGLKLANVAIAVEGASDIAKEAADVILLNRGLGVIFDGIEEGRRTFVNIVKYLKITMASNFGNFYSVAIASLFIDFLPMLPVQILLLNLLSDFPMITIAADSVDIKDLKKPKRYDARDIALTATVLGVVSSIFDFTTFAIFRGYGEQALQTAWFIESVLTEIALIYSLRTAGKFWRGARVPKSILFFTGSAVAAVFLVAFSGFGHGLFRFASPTPWHVLTVIGIAAAYFVSTEAAKLWFYGIRNGNGRNGNNGRRAATA